MGGLEIKTLVSSSKGNCFILSDGTSTILLEAGIPYRRINHGTGYKLSSFDGALVTHAHNDHSHAVNDLLQIGINCYMSAGCAEELGISGYRVKTVPPLKPFQVGTFKVIPFDIKHDAKEPFGYLIKSEATGKTVLFLTDTYYVSYQFKNVDIVMIECNYITENMIRSNTHPSLKKRILTSHMSMESCIKFLQEQDLSRCRMIYLTHLSKERSDAEVMRRAVARQTGCQVEIAH